MYGRITNCWLNINRKCNLKCSWCYAKSSDDQDMDINKAKRIFDFLEKINIKRVTILGGEPTCYEKLPQLLYCAREHGIAPSLVTNAVNLSEKGYLDSLLNNGLASVGVSMKGYDRANFAEVTGVDEYEQTLEAIDMIANINIPSSVSYVMTEDNIMYLEKGIKDVKKRGAKHISLSFCYTFDAMRGISTKYENPYLMAQNFVKNYEQINSAAKGDFHIFQTLPECVWDLKFLSKLEKRGQLRSICQLMKKSGLIFSSDGRIIPCNAMHDITLGYFEKDFYDKNTFEMFWNSDKVNMIYDRLRAFPDNSCKQCKKFNRCGGGCISNWFNYSFKELHCFRGNEVRNDD